MPLVATRGAASAQGFGEFAQSAVPNYIEDVFSTYLYTGNGYPTSNTQSINNGIDLAGKGGLVWFKVRSQAGSNALVDTARGYDKYLYSNITAAQGTATNALTAFNNNGFSLGADSTLGVVNENNQTYASWTFRKQPKFFDVVTYTGNGGTNRAVTHSLGSAPGCIIVKRTDTATDWYVYHRSSNSAWTGGTTAGVTTGGNATGQLKLNQTGAFNAFGGVFTYINGTAFGVNFDDNSLNVSGGTYVAYLFAHNAGGFGLTGTDNVISCGSFTTDGSGNATVSLGYEPQWIMIKGSDNTAGWSMWDTMRGLPVGGADAYLFANSTAAEATFNNVDINATGFNAVGWGSSSTYIYIAIRRGPMKTPTTGTSVFDPVLLVDGSTNRPPVNSTINAPDLAWSFARNAVYGYGSLPRDRLSSAGISYLETSSTAAEASYAGNTFGFTRLQKGIDGANAGSTFNQASPGTIYWMFGRAPGFFDLVCYTGNNVYQQAQTHNLGVAPELIIVKRRNATANWAVGCNFTNTEFQYLNLNSGADGGNTNAYTTGGFFGGRPTATTFILAQNSITNASGGTYVAYLFATLAGVSKVGTYTGTGALQTINCGFTSGARFVLIKRLGDNVDPGTGDWFVYDSTRGITSGNDPYLLINSATAEVTGTNYVDTTSVGFQVTAAAPAGLNANGGTYIFLAIA